jgi:bacillithiol system protein YtxJ
MIPWIELQTVEQLHQLKEQSFQRPQILFKHSTRCSISSMAKSRLERGPVPVGVDFYYLDLIRFREISNQIADEFQVWHESPQLLLIRNGVCTYDESHNAISMAELEDQLAAAPNA